MASKILAFGVPSVLAVGGALTASSLLASASNDESTGQPTTSGTAKQGSVFDFNATFLGQTLSYKKDQVVASVKEVSKEIKHTGTKIAEGSK